MGDINLNIRNEVDNYTIKRYKEINSIYSLDFVNTTECTRITNESATLIDHMLTNSIEMIRCFGVIHNGVSDHSMSYLIWKAHQTQSHVNYVTYRKSKGVDTELFKSDLSHLNWTEVEDENIDVATDNFEKLLFQVVNKHMPLKTKRVRKSKSAWLNESIFEFMKKRDLAKRKAIKTQNNNDWKDYRVLKNKVTALIKKAKRNYYTEQLTKEQNSSKSWKILASLIPKKSSSSQPPPGQCQSKANQFNYHFANVATGLNSGSSEDENMNSNVRGSHIHYPFNFSVVSEGDIFKEIQQLKNKKSVGMDGISVNILKISKEDKQV